MRYRIVATGPADPYEGESHASCTIPITAKSDQEAADQFKTWIDFLRESGHDRILLLDETGYVVGSFETPWLNLLEYDADRPRVMALPPLTPPLPHSRLARFYARCAQWFSGSKRNS